MYVLMYNIKPRGTDGVATLLDSGNLHMCNLITIPAFNYLLVQGLLKSCVTV
jgi:hypothetical protein